MEIANYSGRGMLLEQDDKPIAPVRYWLTVTESIPSGLKDIRGRAEGLPFDQVAQLLGREITLELDDGRRWDCFVQSTSGNLAPRGGLYRP